MSKSPRCDIVKRFVKHFVTPEIWTLTLLESNTDPFPRWLLKKSHWSGRLSDPTQDPRNNTRQRPAEAPEGSDTNSEDNSHDTRQVDFASVRYKPDEEDPNNIELYETVGMAGLKWLPQEPQSSG